MHRHRNHHTLFPIDGGVFHNAVVEFSAFNQEEISLLEAVNSTMLHPDSPSKFVMDFNMRPDLIDGDMLSKKAYHVGVIFGRRVILDSIQLEPGESPATIKPYQADVIRNNVSRHGQYIPSIERAAGTRSVEEASTNGFLPYLRPEDEIENDALRDAWYRAGIEFCGTVAIKSRIADEVPKGLRDLFRVYALLSQEPEKKWSVKSASTS